jgi:hypothetical protein
VQIIEEAARLLDWKFDRLRIPYIMLRRAVSDEAAPAADPETGEITTAS